MFENPVAKAVGEKLELERKRRGLRVEDLANRTGKAKDHVQAVLDGYPNTNKRPTQLDTVNAIASELGLKLDLIPD